MAKMRDISQPMHKFLVHLVQVLLSGKGRYNFTNLSRWSQFSERTLRRNYDTSFNRDFYGSCKRWCINFFILSIISDASKNPVNNLVTNRVQDQHLILSLLHLSMVIVRHLSLAGHHR